MKSALPPFYLFILIVFLSACAPKIYVQDAYSIESSEGQIHNDGIELDLRFAADAYDFLIFELDIINDSEETAFISGKDVILYLYETGDSKPRVLPMLDKDRLLAELKAEREEIDQEKRAGTTLGIISAGLDLLSFAIAGGSGVEAVFYSMESATYILEGRRQLDLIKGDIEDQMTYINDWIIDEEEILPGDTISYDLLFERTLVDADAVLELIVNDQIYEFEYEFYVKEERAR